MKLFDKKSLVPFVSRLMAAGIALCLLYVSKMTPEELPPEQKEGILAAIALGGLIILAWVMGDLFQRLSLPRITGYMITGLITGPHILRLMNVETVSSLKFIDNLALSLIALHAGHEVKLGLLRRRFKSIVCITFFILLFSLCGVFVFIYFGGSYIFPFLKEAPRKTILVVALLFGLIEVAKSPVTTIAILDETGARGPLAETTLGIVILKDVILIILFGIMMTVCGRILYPQKAQGGLLGETLWHLFGSLGMGVLIGIIVGFLLKITQERMYILVAALALCLTLLSLVLHLEVLMVSMTAGFMIQNFTAQGKRFLSGIEAISPITYIIFFPVASASLDISLLRDAWAAAVMILILRKIMVFTGINVGSRLTEDFPAMRKYGWMGFINQSGVTLALALIIGKKFPEFGSHFKAVALGMIVITDFYGPALFKFALFKSGEARKR